jgi:hypothetical protein
VEARRRGIAIGPEQTDRIRSRDEVYAESLDGAYPRRPPQFTESPYKTIRKVPELVRDKGAYYTLMAIS